MIVMVSIEVKQIKSNYWLTLKNYKICELECEGLFFVMFGGYKS